MSSPYPDKEDGNSNSSNSSGSSSRGAERTQKPTSWFSSWFENDNSDMQQQIHRKLNEFDEYQQQQERHNPFFWGMHSNPMSPLPHLQQQQRQNPTSSLQREMEEFFESAGFGGLHPSPMWANSGDMSTMSSSTSSSSIRTQGGTYQMMRKEDQNGVQIDIQFPLKIDPQSISVNVLQEYPCTVEWRKNHAAPPGMDGREFRDHARLGESIDCSKLSASLSSARNALTIHAPRLAPTPAGGQEQQPRLVPVTERDE